MSADLFRKRLDRVQTLAAGLKRGSATHMDALDKLADVAPGVLRELEDWQRAAYLKVRTRVAIAERIQAGDSPLAVAADYDVPMRFVEAISEAGFDLWVDEERRRK